MRTIGEYLRTKYFNREMDFRMRLFNVLAISGATISFFTMIQSLVGMMWIVAMISAIMMLLSLFIMFYAVKSGNYHRCYYITIVTIFMLLFPLLFFLSGGYHGGMPAAFIFAILFTMLMLDGWSAFIMAGGEILLYVISTWVAYNFPATVVHFSSEEKMLKDILFGTIAVAVSTGVVVFLHIREYNLQRQQLEEKNERLRQMDEAKSTFLTTVAHEVKNPLNIISLHAQDTMELSEETPVDIGQIAENQKTISETVLRLDRILTDLMDTVSIEQGRLVLSMAPMGLDHVIDEVAKPWQKRQEKKKIHTEIRLELDRTLAPICGDYFRVYQVLSNLLDNAFHHTPNGVVTVYLEGGSGYQQVCVEDNGQGMTEQMREKALKGYVSASKEYWRHGIGLYVCSKIVEAHKGKIWIESKLGEGTRVYFTLPEKENR